MRRTFPKPCYFAHSLFFEITQGTSIPSNYIYFMKTTNEWIVGDIIRPFGD